MAKYSTIIFDLDGTLVDTSEGIFNSIRFAQQQLHLPEITPQQMRSHIGPPMQESYNRNFHLTGDALQRAIDLHVQYALTKGLYEVAIYEGIPHVLQTLHQQGFRLAVATLKLEETAQKMLQYLNIAQYFNCICGALKDKHISKKQLLEKCMDICHSTQRTTLLVGDSKYDAQGAAEAGMDFLGVLYGFDFATPTDVADFSHIGIAPHVEDILPIINAH